MTINTKKANGSVSVVMGVVVVTIVVASVAIPLINDINTSGWAGTDVLILGLVPTLLLLGATVMLIVKYFF